MKLLEKCGGRFHQSDNKFVTTIVGVHQESLCYSDDAITNLTIVDCDIHLNAGLNADAGDLLHDVARRVQVDQPLVDAHLEAVPSVGPLPAGRLAGGNLELPGREADGAAHVELLVQRALLEVAADLLQVLHVTRGEGDADAVHLGAADVFDAGVFLAGGNVGRGHGECALAASDCGARRGRALSGRERVHILRSTDRFGATRHVVARPVKSTLRRVFASVIAGAKSKQYLLTDHSASHLLTHLKQSEKQSCGTG